MNANRLRNAILISLTACPLGYTFADPLPFSGWSPGAPDTTVSEWNQNFSVTDRGENDVDGRLDAVDDVIFANTSVGTAQDSVLMQRSSLEHSINIERPDFLPFHGNINVEAIVTLPGGNTSEGTSSVLVQLESSIANRSGYLITVNGQQPAAFDFFSDGDLITGTGFTIPRSRAWARFELPGKSDAYSVKVEPAQTSIFENLHSLRIDTAYTANGTAPIPVIGDSPTTPDPQDTKQFPGIVETFESDTLSSLFDGSWVLSSAEESGRSQSLTNADINDNQTSTVKVETLFDKAGTVHFDFSTSTEKNFDFFVFSIDGEEMVRHSGSVAWQAASFPVSVGNHTLSWSYIKDGSVSTANDQVWIDNLEFKPESTTPPTSPPTSDTTKTLNVLMLTSKLESEPNALTRSDLEDQFTRMNALLDQLSHGRAQVNMVALRDLGTFSYSDEQIAHWTQTSSVISRMLREEGRQPHSENCDLAVEGPKAQRVLDGLTTNQRAQRGITIDTLDFSFINERFPQTACRDLAFGDVLTLGNELPSDVDYESVDIIIYSPFDSNLHAGGYSIGLEHSGFKLPDSLSVADKDRIDYILSGANSGGLRGSLSVEPGGPGGTRSSSEFLNNAAYILTSYSRVTLHEMLHAFGIGTHDNGLEYYSSDATVRAANTNPRQAHTLDLGYGDWFSLLGRTHFSAGLAPSSREYLGWFSSDQVVNINQESGNAPVSIKPLSRAEGAVVGKIRVPDMDGYLYVSFESNEGEYATLNHPSLQGNTQGAIIRFAEDNGPGRLSTSNLLDPDGNQKNHDFSLKAGQSFTLGKVTVTVNSVTADALEFSTVYTN